MPNFKSEHTHAKGVFHSYHANEEVNDLETAFLRAFLQHDFSAMEKTVQKISDPKKLAEFAEKAVNAARSRENLQYAMAREVKQGSIGRHQLSSTMFANLFSSVARAKMLRLWINSIDNYGEKYNPDAPHCLARGNFGGSSSSLYFNDLRRDAKVRDRAAQYLLDSLPWYEIDCGLPADPSSSQVAATIQTVIEERLNVDLLVLKHDNSSRFSELPTDIINRYLSPMSRG